MKLLHFADLHLDAPFAWARPETARLRRQNRRETLRRILELAEAEQVDAVLCAGDLFEHDRLTPDSMEFLRASFARTDRRIYLAPGNHDWFSARSPYATIDWSANVHVFSEARLEPVTLADGLTLWGAAHRAPANTDGFFADFRPDRGGVHLALAHASERTVLAREVSGKEPHAPFDSAELAEAGLAHAFLGHFHVPRDEPLYTYPGNPDPLDFGEQGDRGPVLATLTPAGVPQRLRVPVAVSEVHDLEVDLTGAEHGEDVRARVEAALAAVAGCVRVTLRGELPPGVAWDPIELSRLGPHLDGLVLRAASITSAYDLDAIAAQPTVMGRFVTDARAEIADPERLRRVILTGLRALEGRTDLGVA